MVLWYGTGPASALFHADCGGHTSAAADIWGGTVRPYLKAAADDGAAQSAHTTWKFEATRARMTAALNADPRTRVGKELREIRIAHRDDGGRAVMITLKGTREITVDFPQIPGLRQTWRNLPIPADGEATYYYRMQLYQQPVFTWPPADPHQRAAHVVTVEHDR